MDTESKDKEYIILKSTHHEQAQWLFPRATKCPFHRCGESFKTRRAAIEHYRLQHAALVQYCAICEKPISNNHIRSHFLRVHPDDKFLNKTKNVKHNTILREKTVIFTKRF